METIRAILSIMICTYQCAASSESHIDIVQRVLSTFSIKTSHHDHAAIKLFCTQDAPGFGHFSFPDRVGFLEHIESAQTPHTDILLRPMIELASLVQAVDRQRIPLFFKSATEHTAWLHRSITLALVSALHEHQYTPERKLNNVIAWVRSKEEIEVQASDFLTSHEEALTLECICNAGFCRDLYSIKKAREPNQPHLHIMDIALCKNMETFLRQFRLKQRTPPQDAADLFRTIRQQYTAGFNFTLSKFPNLLTYTDSFILWRLFSHFLKIHNHGPTKGLWTRMIEHIRSNPGFNDLPYEKECSLVQAAIEITRQTNSIET